MSEVSGPSGDVGTSEPGDTVDIADGDSPEHSTNWLAVGLLVGALVAAVVAAILLLTRDENGDGDGGGGDGGAPAAEAVPIVESIQRDLQALGFYDGDVDGQYNEAVVAAVEAFQSDAGLTVDGRYGSETHAALEEALRADGQNSQTVIEIQEVLTDLGWYDGEIDGIYGPGTSIAIAEFQAHLGLTPDGIIGPETAAAYQSTCGEDRDSCRPPAPAVNLTTSDGVAVSLTLESCQSATETDIELAAQSDTAQLEVDAEASQGTIRYQSEDGDREGIVDTVMVGADGRFSVSGTLNLIDDASEPATFQLTGSCVTS